MWLEADDGRGRNILWPVVGWNLLPLVGAGFLALFASPTSLSTPHLYLSAAWLVATVMVFGWMGAESRRRRAWEDVLWMIVVPLTLIVALKLAGEGGWARFDALLSHLSLAPQAIEATRESLFMRFISLACAGGLVAVAAHDCAYRAREAMEDFGFLEPRDFEDAPPTRAARAERARTQTKARPHPQDYAAPPPPPSPEELREASARAALGVGVGATKREILRAYKALIKRAHPDHGGSTEAAARLNTARDILLGK